MKRSLLLFFLALTWLAGVSQLKPLTLEDAILRSRTSLSPENMNQLKWIPGTDRFSYVKEIDEEPVLLAGAADSKKRDVLVSLEEVNTALRAVDMEERSRFPRYQYTDATHFRFLHKNRVIMFDLESKKAEVLTRYQAGARNPDLNRQQQMAYTIGQNLFVSLPGDPDRAVTNEESEYIRHGEATHRFEFGILQGTFWSPKGDKLAFYRADETMVTLYPLLKLSKRPAGYEVVPYPFAGEPSHHATLGVYDAKSKETIYLKTGGDPEHYLTNVTWSPDGKDIYIQELNRDQNELSLNRYNASTGERTATVLTEKHEKYIQPMHGLTFLPGKSDEFIFQSQRDGFNHLYHYKNDGTLLRQVTSGGYEVTQVIGFDEKGKEIYFVGTTNLGLGRHLMRAGLKKGDTYTYNADLAGTHRVKMSEDRKFFIDTHSSNSVPRTISIRSTKDGSEVQQLLNAPNPLKDYKVGSLKLMKIKAADGKTDLWCRMITPPDFDPNKKYPALIYVYNGPGVQIIDDRWQAGAPMWMHVAASEGMVVFSVDGRGSAHRGLEFEQAIFRDLGTVEMDDQLEGVKYLKGLPYIDGDRLAIHGWSYGGFMTTAMMTRHPDVFKVGVAGGPVIDWSLYEVMYTERYMDTPKDNPEGFKRSNLMNYVDQLKGKLLLIHGTSDDVVVWQHSLAYIEECVKKGTQVDYFVYPNHPHNVRGKDRIHLIRKVLDYVQDHL